MQFKYLVSIFFIETFKEHDLDMSFQVSADNITHAWMSAINYIKSLGLDPDLVEYFSVELL